jgi:hypothetical protein
MEIVKDHVHKWIGGRFKDLSTIVEKINSLREKSENEEEVVQKISALLQGTLFVVNISKRRASGEFISHNSFQTALKAAKEDEIEKALTSVNLAWWKPTFNVEGCKMLVKLLDTSNHKISDMDFGGSLDRNILEALKSRNILMEHRGSTITFHSRVVENYLMEKIGLPGSPERAQFMTLLKEQEKQQRK